MPDTTWKRPAGAAAVAVVLAVLLAAWIGPHPPEPPRRVSGDAALAARLTDVLGGSRGISTVAVALVEEGGGRVTYAGLDQPGGSVTQDTPFEIGSVTKAMTGMLLADAVERGEVSLDTPAGDLVAGTGRATLADLSTHHSGLPRLPTEPLRLVRAATSRLTGANPYAGTPGEVLAQARSAGAPGGADYGYSNLGAATLGQVLADRLGRPYERALDERILRPLGMTSTRVVLRPQDLPGGAIGKASNGRRQDPWIGAGYAPAGVGVWSTASDLSRLVTGLLRGQAPGAASTRPLAGTGSADRRIGLGWFTSQVDGRTVTWHNGATGGFRSFVGFDAAAGRGVVVLASTSRDVDDAALALLTGKD